MTSVVSVVAECNSSYFNLNNIPYDQSWEGGQCLYHFPLKVQFWQGRQVNLKPFKIIGAVLLGLVVLIAIGWLLLRRQFRQINAAILRYSSLKPTDGGKVPYENMIEEKEEPTVEMAASGGKRKPQGKLESEDGLNPKKSVHEIGD